MLPPTSQPPPAKAEGLEFNSPEVWRTWWTPPIELKSSPKCKDLYPTPRVGQLKLILDEGKGLPVATLDKNLIAAAKRCGVPVLSSK